MIARSPLGRRRPQTRKSVWQAARWRLPPTQLAALAAFRDQREGPLRYPDVDPYDPDESEGGPLRVPPAGRPTVPGRDQGAAARGGATGQSGASRRGESSSTASRLGFIVSSVVCVIAQRSCAPTSPGRTGEGLSLHVAVQGSWFLFGCSVGTEL